MTFGFSDTKPNVLNYQVGGLVAEFPPFVWNRIQFAPLVKWGSLTGFAPDFSRSWYEILMVCLNIPIIKHPRNF